MLLALRTVCGVQEAIKFKADGVTLLDLYADNEYGIPPSFYSASRDSVHVSHQTSNGQQWCKHGAGCKHLRMVCHLAFELVARCVP